MLREALKKLTQEQLVSEIVRLYSAMEILERQIIQMSDSIESHKNRIEELKAENTALKQRIKDLEDIGNNYEPQFAPDDDISAFNYECVKQWTTEMGCKRKIQELQDQHQQDCIRINDLMTTVHVLVGLYSALRKNVGMD